jgi:hypothetical protein
MIPAIVHPQGKPGEAFLIDLHATAFVKRPQGVKLPPGMIAGFALKAVRIKHLRAGEMANIEGTSYPAPCQVIATSAWVVNDPMSRGIYPDAAIALLTINHGIENAVAPLGDFKMGKEAPGFNKWHFAIAWAWSAWQTKHRQGDKWTLERRWLEMKNALQYPDSFSSFKVICSRLNLSVTKSRPSL